jgi:hypothetical protein
LVDLGQSPFLNILFDRKMAATPRMTGRSPDQPATGEVASLDVVIASKSGARCSVLSSDRHVRENGEMAGGIEYSDFDRVGTVSIFTRIQQKAVTDSGGRVREVLAYIGSILTIGGSASQYST